MPDVRPPSPRRRLARTGLSGALAWVVAVASILPGAAPAAAATTWTRNLWVSSAFVYQDPYYTACTAASVMTMLNTIASRRTGGEGFDWRPYRVQHNATNPADARDMTSILAFERRNDTLRSSSAGSDAHGWRNALNFYGWGREAMADPARRVYDDVAFGSVTSAIRAAVRAIARFGMPVGVLAWAGGHAQVITGYVVTGADPRVSDAFTVQSVYLSDPLRKAATVNRKVSLDRLRYGWLGYRFQAYRETDSPWDDPWTPGTRRSSVRPSVGPSEWYGRWVLLLPIRAGSPVPPPPPTPTPPPIALPTPMPTPTPTLGPTPTPTVSPTPTATPSPTAPPSPTEPPPTEPPSTEPGSTPSVEPPQTPTDPSPPAEATG